MIITFGPFVVVTCGHIHSIKKVLHKFLWGIAAGEVAPNPGYNDLIFVESLHLQRYSLLSYPIEEKTYFIELNMSSSSAKHIDVSELFKCRGHFLGPFCCRYGTQIIRCRQPYNLSSHGFQTKNKCYYFPLRLIS